MTEGTSFKEFPSSIRSCKDVLLALPAAGYCAIQKTWAGSFALGLAEAAQAPIPVISVGNILLGGSGKTPFVIYLADLLRREGLRPAVVSRGYGGSNRAPWLCVSDGNSEEPFADPSIAGDEPVLIALRVPTVPVLIARKRIQGVEAAHRDFGCDVAVLDDGFQHLRLKRDVDIVLLSGREDRMFPLGSLREPFSALERAHIFVLTGNIEGFPRRVQRFLAKTSVFRCRTVSLCVGLSDGGSASPEAYAGRRVILVSAIAQPDRFRATAEGLGWAVSAHHVFRDHHRFSQDELDRLIAGSSGLPLIFTEKDWVRLPPWFREIPAVTFLRIGVEMEDEAGFSAALRDRLRAAHA